LREIDRHLGFWFEDYTRKATEDEFQTEEGVEGPPVRKFTTEQIVELMQSFGVPCGIVASAEAVANDPQLKHRKHYWHLEHPYMGLRQYDSPAFKLSKTPAELTKAAPMLGEDNEYVYKSLVGLTDDEYVELLADGAFE
jgi:benzylsuccinate CoA-transferase BbsF subunit